MSGENGIVAGRSVGRRLLRLTLPAVIALLAAAGMAVASYLAYGGVGDRSLYCELGHGCDAVQDSEYSMVLGVPVAVWGGLLYLGILAAAVSVLVLSEWPGKLSPHAILGMALAGTLYSGYLAWVEVYRIESVCMWCTASAIIIAAILVTAIFNLAFGQGKPATDVRGREVMQDGESVSPVTG